MRSFTLIDFIENEDSITFTIRVVPRASKNEIAGCQDGILRVRISAPPVDGAANEEVVRVLAKAFGVARSSVSILSGNASRTKRIRIVGGPAQKLREPADGP